MHLADHGFLAPISLFWTLPCQRPRHDAKGTNTTHDASLLSPPQDTHLPSAPSSAGLSPNPTPNSLLLPAPAPPLRQRRRRPCLLGLSLFLFRPPGLISSHARPVHSFCPPQQPPTRPARLDVIACSRPVAAVADHGPADSFDAGPDRPQQPALRQQRRTSCCRHCAPLRRQVLRPPDPIHQPQQVGPPEGRLGDRRSHCARCSLPRSLGRGRHRVQGHLRPRIDRREAQPYTVHKGGAARQLPLFRGHRRAHGEPVARGTQADPQVVYLRRSRAGAQGPPGAARRTQQVHHAPVALSEEASRILLSTPQKHFDFVQPGGPFTHA